MTLLASCDDAVEIDELAIRPLCDRRNRIHFAGFYILNNRTILPRRQLCPILWGLARGSGMVCPPEPVVVLGGIFWM